MAERRSPYPAASALPYPALVVDEDHRIIYGNRAAQETFGRGRSLEGALCHEMVHPDQGIVADCPLEKAIATGEFVDLERFDETSGRWYRCGLHPLPREKEEPRLYLHTFEDVTERVESDRNIRRLNRALHTISASNQALLRAEDEQELMQEVCRVAVEVGGFRLAWVGRKENDPEKTITPIAWAGHNEGFLEEAGFTWGDGPQGRGSTSRAIRTGGSAVTRSTESRVADAWREGIEKRGYRSSAGVPLIVGGEIYGVLSLYAAEEEAFGSQEILILEELARDLSFRIFTLRTHTERRRAEQAIREAEERHRKLVEGSPFGIVVVDGNGVVQYTNPAAGNFLGSSSSDELIGRSMTDFVRSDFAQEAWERLSIVKAGTPTPPTEVEVVREDGSTRWVETSAIPLDFEGEPVANVVVRDLTEQKKAEAALAESEEQLRQSQKLESVGQLAGGVAHDFNNLLTVISGDTQLLREKDGAVDPEELREYLDEIGRAATRGTNLTSQLLAFSRRQPYQARVVDLNEAVAHMDGLLRRTVGECIEIDTRLFDDLWPVEIDPHRLEQVVLNLAVNARDAMPEDGKLTIETANATLDESYVSTHLGSKPGEYAMLAVSDDGIGIDEETAAHVFDPFFTTKGEGKGTGLGLSTVYGIVKQFGGNVWVYSEPGEGTTFKIYLPRSEKPADWHPADKQEEAERRKDVGGEETVLVVEDEESVRGLAERVLSRQGYRVITAASGTEALETAEKSLNGIDLLLTDVVLPGMSGKTLAEEIRQAHPSAKILYMSGYTRNAIVHEGRMDDDVNLVEKPFSLDGLVRAVRKALDAQAEPVG